MVAAVLVGISNGGIEVEDIQVPAANDAVFVIEAVKPKIGHALRLPSRFRAGAQTCLSAASAQKILVASDK
jgi:hypothetical protein